MIPEEKLEELISEVNIVSYIRDLGCDLQDNLQMNCPFHPDDTPSLSVHPEDQYFYCFGCEIGGNVINFHMHYMDEDFLTAVRAVADYANYDLGDIFGEEQQKRYNESQNIYDIYNEAADYCHDQLPDDLRETLKENYGFTDEFIDEKKIGYGDETLFQYLKSQGYKEKQLMKTGLFNRGKYFNFRTRLIFWYWKRGKPQYAIARKTEVTKQLDNYEKYEKAKYKKLPIRPDYISDLIEEPVYNSTVCRNTNNRPSFVVITEGITDAMICQMLDIPVISPVTKVFKKEDHSKLKRITKHIDTIYIINDNDRNDEGFKGALDTAQSLNKEGKKVYITELPDPPQGQDSYDLNDFLREHGRDEFEDYVHKNSKLYLDLLVDKAMEFQEKDNETKMYEMLDKALYEAKNMKEIPKQKFFKDISNKINTRVKDVRAHFKEVVKEEKTKPEYKESDEYLDDILERKKEQESSEAHQLFKELLKQGAKFYSTDQKDKIEVTMVYDGEFYRITDEKSEFTMLLMLKFGYNYRSHKTKKLISEFEAKAYHHSTKRKKQTWLYCDKRNRTLYLPLGKNCNSILKVTPGQIKTIYNGEDDGIFIDLPPVMKKWEFKEDINKVEVAKDLKKEVSDYFVFDDFESLMYLISLMTTPLKRFADSVVLIKIHGESGSGKSKTCEMVSNLFYGKPTLGKMTEASKYDQSSKRPFIFLDNVENVKEHEIQFLLFSASGGVREKRDTSSESGTVQQRVDSMVCINGIHPFAKTELLNRSIDFAAHVRHHKEVDLVSVNERIIKNRDKYLSLWIHLLQNCLNQKEAISEKRSHLAKQPKHFKSRLNSYYALMWHMLEKFQLLLGIEKEQTKKDMMNWIKEQSQIGENADRDTNKVVRYLNTLVDYIQNGRAKHNDFQFSIKPEVQRNGEELTIKFELSARALINNFDKIAKDLGNRPNFKNSQQLMARLRNSNEVLSKNGWIINTGYKKVSGTNIHKFVYTEKPEHDESWDQI